MPSFNDMTIADFIAQASSDAPVPGGGSIAALAGALGAAMASMAANFTVGRPKYAEHDALMRGILDRLSPAIDSLGNAVDADAAAFSGISTAYKLPRDGKEDVERRKLAIQAALTASMRVPREVLRQCHAAAVQLPALARAANSNLLSDVEVAALMLDAAARAARVNVMTNARQLDGDEAREAVAEADDLVGKVSALAEEARQAAAKRTAAKT